MPSAPRPVITVTQEQLGTALRADSSHCMVADALREAYPDYRHISVDLRTIRFTHRGERYTYLTPLTVATKLAQWDQGINPTPFSIRLSSAIQVRQAGRKNANLRRVTGVRQQSQNRLPIVEGGSPAPHGALKANARRRTTTRGVVALGQRSRSGRQFGIKSLNLTGLPANDVVSAG